MKRDAATQAQVDAARPDQSTWLAANAGSGKTRVLTDRVARLLLEGVSPEHILCLTYTKAAATEMQNRLFKRLGDWAMLSQDGLHAELVKLGVEKTLSDAFLRDARTLFARAIETPGGLRIQTIHSFCSSLLRRFPLEAKVSPQFKEMEDRAAERLRAEILDRMAEGPQAPLIGGIVPYLTDESLTSLVAELTRFRDVFATKTSPAQIMAAYGLPEDADENTAAGEVFLGSEKDLLSALIPFLKEGGKTDATLADHFARFTAPDAAGLALMQEALLTQSGTIRKTLGTKKPRTNAPDLFEQLDQLAARVEAARQTQIAVRAARRDIALYAFAQHFVPAYEAEKLRRGWLDFDDLITRARDLLSDPKVADWVLYRLDGGIDHILVDEAQDTSPVQWQVIERLAHEFTSGEGARQDIRRTIFVVGDKKQSIYSFQGADPSEFDRMRDDFAERLARTETPLASMTLKYSFRSASPILSLVDATFEGAEASGFSADQTHAAFKDRMPGRVDLWPLIDKVDDDEDGDWFEPLDRVGSTHQTVILAQRIARFIRRTIDAGHPLPVELGFSGEYEARPVHAGDFLILVRSRNRLFKEIIRACKQENLPIAGADRLKVMAELAVKDIIALLSFLATPEDSLSLATALRSPLFGLSEQQLYDIARSRIWHRDDGEGPKEHVRHLWEELRDHRKDDYPQVLAILHDLMGQTDFLRPYDLIERILTRHKGRRLLVGRLGQEAEDGINALLGQALSYEQTDIPSLTGFLEWAQSDNLEIKRAPDSAGATLRVMTVHGSKGLEAPIVILPDTTAPRNRSRGSLMRDEHGVTWKLGSDLPTRQSLTAEAAKEKEAQERDRLLYVALTRAEKWLVVAAAGELGKNGDAWYDKVRAGMTRLGAQETMFEFGDLGAGEGLTLGQSDWSHLTLTRPETLRHARPDIPPHLLTPAPDPAPVAETLKPSDLGGVKALPGAANDTEEVALQRGTAIHHFLELLAPLPADTREDASHLLLDDLRDDPELDLVTDLLDPIRLEALTVLQTPALAPYFDPNALAEVPITATLPRLGRIHGVIDRLIIAPDKVIAVDFKSNRTTPKTPDKTPEALLRQMGAYAAALAQLYPDKTIETGLIWTATATYMPLPHDLVTQALERATTP
ncbi:double-strand break repair helicase AddA [Tropicibacter naphthalenivorans]|uniref:DNA 3'-5' helicase n=1 Tax=Tropicibacter naphthalenivorans TaxID=441103 RepID=A0A0P1H0F1_9RHOB|nr:double-strand break repair helicase AddA [Tropicibacter naphthalenivorans]CUH79539.1 ATP-dependent helicase/nuclease subunit A [Tropicibacter naphthalenivorans]SMC73393.1 DNA helicase/exodeoxyribonuclease V, subunit A [Tropicibacter naphthalenivorans]